MDYLAQKTALQAVTEIKPDEFFIIPDWKNHEITLTGIVRNVNTGRILKSGIQRSAVRYYVTVCGRRVHRMIMSASLGRPLRRNELVRHRDGNTFGNRLDNLAIGTARENACDRVEHGTNGRLLSCNQVREIRRLFAAGRHSACKLAAQYRVTPGHVRAIIARRRWANLP